MLQSTGVLAEVQSNFPFLLSPFEAMTNRHLSAECLSETYSFFFILGKDKSSKKNSVQAIDVIWVKDKVKQATSEGGKESELELSD